MVAPSNKFETLGNLRVAVDSLDPTVNILSMVSVCKGVCEASGKQPVEGVLMLMTAAAWLLDHHVEDLAKQADKPVDIEHLIHTYMQLACESWNANGFLFRGITERQIGEATMRDREDGDEETPDPQDRTRWN
jgi:hypothetical protein